METLDLRTGFELAVFPDYKKAKEWAEEQKRQYRKVCYCGKLEWAQPMHVKQWPQEIMGNGFMDYRYTEADYYDRSGGKKSAPTIRSSRRAIEIAVEVLAKRQGIAAQSIVVVKKYG